MVWIDGVVHRVVDPSFRESFELFESSGLVRTLQSQGLLIEHEALSRTNADELGGIALLKPKLVEFVSYPYEWSFEALKDAALATLRMQRIAIEHGMSLRDASAFNIQFESAKPVCIDSLSFAKFEEASTWGAYGQFCRHFLAPLALMAFGDVEAGRFTATWIDGIPLGLASSLLPRSTKWKPGLAMHMHWHARAQTAEQTSDRRPAAMSLVKHLGLVDSLERTILGLRPPASPSIWSDYYAHTNYSDAAMESKRATVRRLIEEASPRVVWDLGANTGEFSDIAESAGASVVAWDADAASVDKHFRKVKGRVGTRILPLVGNLACPTPALGWDLCERRSFFDRANADLVLALALVHHLAIGNNVPFPMICSMFARLGRWLVVEFVPKEDSQVARLLAHRDDIFDDYTQTAFEAALRTRFEIRSAQPVEGSKRTIYLCERKAAG